MDKAMLLRHLAMAERHVAEGRVHVDRQTRHVADLQRDGHDTEQARDVLFRFQELLEMHEAERARLKRELGIA